MEEAKSNSKAPKAQRNAQKPSFLNFNSLRVLSETKLDSTVVAILTHLDCEIQMSIGMNNTAMVMVVDRSTRRPLCSLEELSKIGLVRRYLNKISKDKLFEEEMPIVKQILVNFAKKRAHDEGGDKIRIPRITNNMISEMKTLMQGVKSIEGNVETLMATDELSPPDDPRASRIIFYYAKLLRVAYAAAMYNLLNGKPVKGFLRGKFIEMSIPKFFPKLLTEKNRVQPGVPGWKMLFPNDLKKGLSLTVREWRDDGCYSGLISIMERAKPLKKLLSSDAAMQAILRPHRLDFGQVESREMVKFLGITVVVPPPIVDIRDFVKPRSFGKPLGYTSSPIALDAAGQMRHVSATITRALACEILIADSQSRFWDKLFPMLEVQFEHKEPGQHFMAVVLQNLDEDGVETAMWNYVKLHTQTVRDLFKNVLCMMGQWQPTNAAVDYLTAAILADDETGDKNEAETQEAKDEAEAAVAAAQAGEGESLIRDPVGDLITDTWADYFDEVSPVELEGTTLQQRTGRKKKKSRRLRNSSLGGSAAKLVHRMRGTKFDTLIDEVTEWLCEFSNPQVQDTAAYFLGVQLSEGLEAIQDIPAKEDETDSDSDSDSNLMDF